MRRLIQSTAMMIVMAAAVVTTSPSAVADDGDGLENCNRGEICVHEGQTSERYRKHFWYDAVYYSNIKFFDSVTNQYIGLSVLNNVSSVRNRDTECDVRLIDYGTDPDTSYVVANRPDNSINQNIAAVFGDRANAHTRVFCS